MGALVHVARSSPVGTHWSLRPERLCLSCLSIGRSLCPRGSPWPSQLWASQTVVCVGPCRFHFGIFGLVGYFRPLFWRATPSDYLSMRNRARVWRLRRSSTGPIPLDITCLPAGRGSGATLQQSGGTYAPFKHHCNGEIVWHDSSSRGWRRTWNRSV